MTLFDKIAIVRCVRRELLIHVCIKKWAGTTRGFFKEPVAHLTYSFCMASILFGRPHARSHLTTTVLVHALDVLGVSI